MSYRTDMVYENGKVKAARDPHSADTRRPLPKVTPTDRLATDNWGASLINEAGDMGDDAALKTAAETHKQLVRGFHSVITQRETQNPSRTQLEHLRDVERNYQSLVDRAAKQTDNARKVSKTRIDETKQAFEASLNFSTDNAGEIRTMLRGMDDKQRQEFINDAVESGDGNVMAAIFKAHPSLSGLTKESSQARYQQALHKHAPDALKLISSLERADKLLFESFNDLLASTETVTATQVRQEHEQAAAKANDAASKARESLGFPGEF